ESSTVYVGNLSWNVDEEWLQQELAECGEIKSARIITEGPGGRSKGFGYVDFSDASGAQAAAALSGKEIDGRQVRIEVTTPRATTHERREQSAKSNTLFVGNLPFSANEDSVAEVFAAFGEVQSVRLPTDRETGQAKGFGYVQFNTEDEAAAAVAESYVELEGRQLRLDFAGARSNDGGNRGGRGGFGGRGGRGGFGDR
ncbi:hypothetical protein THASP1DRAFT_10033, partial [Thamnocephalis sphaerospora]